MTSDSGPFRPIQFALEVRLSQSQIRQQLYDCQQQDWAMVIEHSADPHHRIWDNWGIPILDPQDPETVMAEISACRKAFPRHFIRVNACEAGRGTAKIRHSLLVHAPSSD